MANHAARAKRAPSARPAPSTSQSPSEFPGDVANPDDTPDDLAGDTVQAQVDGRNEIDGVDQALDDMDTASDGANVASAEGEWQATQDADAADEIVEETTNDADAGADAGTDDDDDDAADDDAATHDDPTSGYTPSQPGEPDYYATLGVAPDATHDEARQAYRRLAKLWHPDRFVSAPPALRAQAERRMRTLNAAYFVVGDSIRRHLYDQRRAERAGADDASGRGYAASRNGYRATADTTDYTGYTAWSGASQRGQFEHASENPNGAGLFFGALALVVGLALFVGASQSGSAWVFVFGGVILVGLIALTLIFTSQTSPFANAATRLMEGEPRGFGDPYVAAGAMGWRGARYADRPPQRAAGAHQGAGARRQSTRHTTNNQATADAPGATDARGPAQAAAPTPTESPATSPTPETTRATPGNATGVAASANAQPPEANDDTAAFARFQQYVVEAVEALPAEFREHMGAIVVRVADEPDAATLRTMSVGKGHSLFGLYEGVPLTKQGITLPPPEIVTIYRGPITRACQGDPARIREQARRTVFHEVAHHFGIDHDEMPKWVK